MIERLALQRPVAERDLFADRLGRGERDDFAGGKAPLGKNAEHLAPDIAGGADDGDSKTCHGLNSSLRFAPWSPAVRCGGLAAPEGGSQSERRG